MAHGRVRRRDDGALRRRRPGLLSERRQAADAEGRRDRVRRARRDLPRDRRPRPRRAPARHERWERSEHGTLGAGRLAPPGQVGDRLVVPDRGRADRPPPRLERGHPRLSLVGQGARPRGRVLGSEGRPGDRGATVDRQGAPARGRRQPLEHVLGRRAALLAHDLHAAPAGAPHGADRRRLPRLLLESVFVRAAPSC